MGVQVLRNKLDLHTFSEWFQAERQLTFLRQQELTAQPELVTRTFDPAHWKAIHYQLFQDMYQWAGQFRTVNIGKDGHGFAPCDQLEHYAAEILGQVREANMFAGRDRAGVIEGLAYTMQAINIIHPFREGNGRTQRTLTEHVAEHAGYLLDWHRISPDEQNYVMAQAFDGELQTLHDALERAVLPILRGEAVDESPWPTEPTGPTQAPNFWHPDKTGEQILADARAQAARQSETAGTARQTAEIEHQNEMGR